MAHDYDELYASVSYGGICQLSDKTIAIAIMSLSAVHKRYQWQASTLPLNDTQWNALDYDISNALDEIMTNIVGWIFPAVIANPTNVGLLLCDGSTYNREDYPLLYASLLPAYILDVDSFQVPDLGNRFVLGTGSDYNNGDIGGIATVKLSIDEIPSHTHNYDKPVAGLDVEGVGVPDPLAISNPMIPTPTSSRGGGQAHENMPPYLALSYYIVSG